MVYIQLECRALLALCYWSVGTIMALGGNGFGSTGAHSYISTNFSTAFRLRNCLFFFFLLFFLCQFLSYFYFFLSVSMVFFGVFSLLSPVSLTLQHPHPTPLLQTRRKDHFVLLQTIRSTIPRCWLTQKERAVLWSERLCTDWRPSVMETLAVILTCRWQVKRPKVPFNSVWKENKVFSAIKNNNKTGKQIEYNTKPKRNLVTKEREHLKRKDRLEDFPHPQ